jgi:serine/threonine protein kinase
MSEHFPVGGSVRWMAPELLHHGDAGESPASDVYSFACTCYEVLSASRILEQYS